VYNLVHNLGTSSQRLRKIKLLQQGVCPLLSHRKRGKYMKTDVRPPAGVGGQPHNFPGKREDGTKSAHMCTEGDGTTRSAPATIAVDFERKPWRLPLVPLNAPERSSWSGMISRCLDPKTPGYENYGGRGISVCRRWQGRYGFRFFWHDMGPRPSSKHTLGRIDNSKGYEPGNCRWETWVEQQNNRRSNRRVRVGEREMTLAQWGRETGVSRQVINGRLRDGWVVEVAVSTPTGVRKAEAHEIAGVSPAGPSRR
jgi:hypothetical protein